MSIHWNNYEVHQKKTWPYAIRLSSSTSLIRMIKHAIEFNGRYISKNGKLYWENPYFEKEKEKGRYISKNGRLYWENPHFEKGKDKE